MVPCLLHAKIRVTEKLLKLALERAIECGKEDNLFEVLENVKYISMMLTVDNEAGLKNLRYWKDKNMRKMTSLSGPQVTQFVVLL